MKKIEAPKRIDEQDREALEAYDEELELYQQFEMPLFIQDMQLHGELTPEQTLQALDAVFYLGIDLTPHGSVDQSFFRGWLPVESSKWFYDEARQGDLSPAFVAKLLRETLDRANDPVPF